MSIVQTACFRLIAALIIVLAWCSVVIGSEASPAAEPRASCKWPNFLAGGDFPVASLDLQVPLAQLRWTGGEKQTATLTTEEIVDWLSLDSAFELIGAVTGLQIVEFDHAGISLLRDIWKGERTKHPSVNFVCLEHGRLRPYFAALLANKDPAHRVDYLNYIEAMITGDDLDSASSAIIVLGQIDSSWATDRLVELVTSGRQVAAELALAVLMDSPQANTKEALARLGQLTGIDPELKGKIVAWQAWEEARSKSPDQPFHIVPGDDPQATKSTSQTVASRVVFRCEEMVLWSASKELVDIQQTCQSLLAGDVTIIQARQILSNESSSTILAAYVGALAKSSDPEIIDLLRAVWNGDKTQCRSCRWDYLKRPRVRVILANGLITIDPESAMVFLDYIRDQLASEHSRTRAIAATLLGQSGSSVDVAALEETLRTGSFVVATHAADAILSLEPRRGREALRQLSNEAELDDEKKVMIEHVLRTTSP